MKGSYSWAMKFLFFYEKYKSNNPDDPGKRTIWGISEKSWPSMVKKLWDLPEQESKRLAYEFYKPNYWDKIDADNLPFPLDMVLFDIAVNQGIGRAKEIRKVCLNWQDALILRLDRWTDISKLYKKCGEGWANRLCSLRDYIVSDFVVLEHDHQDLVVPNITWREKS